MLNNHLVDNSIQETMWFCQSDKVNCKREAKKIKRQSEGENVELQRSFGLFLSCLPTVSQQQHASTSTNRKHGDQEE